MTGASRSMLRRRICTKTCNFHQLPSVSNCTTIGIPLLIYLSLVTRKTSKRTLMTRSHKIIKMGCRKSRVFPSRCWSGRQWRERRDLGRTVARMPQILTPWPKTSSLPTEMKTPPSNPYRKNTLPKILWLKIHFSIRRRLRVGWLVERKGKEAWIRGFRGIFW